MSDPEVVVRLLAAIDERERGAAKIHDERCGLVLGTITGNLNDECDCGIPGDLLRLCQAHRDIVAMFPVSAPIMDANDCFHGFQARDCGEHRTVGSRAWCHDCGEWCYPAAPCQRCHGVSEVIVALARGYGIEDGETK